MLLDKIALQLQDKIILVTGGARGISEGIAQVLARERAVPIIVGPSAPDNQRAVAAIAASGGRAAHVVAELTEPAACAQAVQATVGAVWPPRQNTGRPPTKPGCKICPTPPRNCAKSRPGFRWKTA